MSGKINIIGSKKWMPWVNVILIVAVVAGLHFFFTTRTLIDKSVWMNNPVFGMAVPSFDIFRYSIIESIQQFGGSEMESSQFWISGLKSASGLIIVMILAPWLLVKGCLAMEKSGKPDRLIPVWYAGAAAMIVAIGVTGYFLGSNLIHYQGTNEMREASRSMDELRSVMMDLAFDASEQMILPSEAEDVNVSGAGIRLESLPSYREWEQFEILITEQLGDSVLTLTGSLRDQDLAGSSISKPVTMRITPQNDELFDYVNQGDL